MTPQFIQLIPLEISCNRTSLRNVEFHNDEHNVLLLTQQ